MSDYTERRTVVEDIPIKRARPVVETQYDSVVHERRGMSGVAVAALVLAAIAAAVVITLLVLNSQQKDNEDQLAQERARTAAAQQQAASQQPAQPAPQTPVVVVPSSPTPTVPAPAVTPPAPAETAPSSAQVEIDVTSKILDDSELRSHSIDVKVAGRTAILSGRVPSDELKSRAEKLARTVKGVGRVVNNITVEP